MAAHSSILAWRIPGTEESVGLPSMGLHRVGYDWRDLAAAAVSQLKERSLDTLFFFFFCLFNVRKKIGYFKQALTSFDNWKQTRLKKEEC